MDQNQYRGGRAGAALAALVVGAIGGAIAGVLLAPKSGKETREDLKHVAEKMKHDISENLHQIGEVTKDRYRDVVDTVVNKYQQTKEITHDEAVDLKNKLDKNYDSVKDAMDRDKGSMSPTNTP